MCDIFSNDRLLVQFFQINKECDPRVRMYVYRIAGNRPLTPALYKGAPFPDFLEFLRDDLGGGEFRILIRRGEMMLLSGTALVWSPKHNRR